MEKAESCVCCQEIEQVKNKLIEAVSSGECEEQPKCITQHPGFHPVSTKRWVLQTAWYHTSNSTKTRMMGPKINFLDILLTGNWLDGVGEY